MSRLLLSALVGLVGTALAGAGPVVGAQSNPAESGPGVAASASAADAELTEADLQLISVQQWSWEPFAPNGTAPANSSSPESSSHESDQFVLLGGRRSSLPKPRSIEPLRSLARRAEAARAGPQVDETFVVVTLAQLTEVKLALAKAEFLGVGELLSTTASRADAIAIVDKQLQRIMDLQAAYGIHVKNPRLLDQVVMTCNEAIFKGVQLKAPAGQKWLEKILVTADTVATELKTCIKDLPQFGYLTNRIYQVARTTQIAANLFKLGTALALNQDKGAIKLIRDEIKEISSATYRHLKHLNENFNARPQYGFDYVARFAYHKNQADDTTCYITKYKYTEEWKGVFPLTVNGFSRECKEGLVTVDKAEPCDIVKPDGTVERSYCITGRYNYCQSCSRKILDARADFDTKYKAQLAIWQSKNRDYVFGPRVDKVMKSLVTLFNTYK